MDLEKDQQIDVHVVIPRLYPDIHCTLQVQHTDLSSEKKRCVFCFSKYVVLSNVNINIA